MFLSVLRAVDRDVRTIRPLSPDAQRRQAEECLRVAAAMVLATDAKVREQHGGGEVTLPVAVTILRERSAKG